MPIPDLELTITRDHAQVSTAALVVELPGRRAELADQVPIAINDAALRALTMAPDAYADALSSMIFVPALREAWQRALGYAEGAGARLRVRLNLKGDGGLHALRWELLRDPTTSTPLAYREAVSFSRYQGSNSLVAIYAAGMPQLHAIIAVSSAAGPGMAAVDVAGEVDRAVAGLSAIPATILDGRAGRPPATLADLAKALRGEAQILYLVCHGILVDGKPSLYLERQPGEPARPIPGSDFVRQIADLARRPLLIVLASCRGAGDNYHMVSAVGPQLARAGVGAVIAMQGDVPMELVAQLTPRLFAELRHDGQIDRALAAARAALPSDQPWWLPTLWMAVRDGALWHTPEAAPALDAPPPDPAPQGPIQLSLAYVTTMSALFKRCGEFQSNRRLRAVFTVAELQSYQDGLPDATSREDRVDQLIDYVRDKRGVTGEPVLALFLQTLIARRSAAQGEHGELLKLLNQLPK